MKALSLSESIPRTGTGKCRRVTSSPSTTSDFSGHPSDRFGPS